MNSLEQLKQHSVVVADTGDFHRMREFAPRDATTNPTLILKAVQDPQYADLFARALTTARHKTAVEQVDQVLVEFGCEILRIIPGRVSTEVDARLSFDVEATMQRAWRIIERYSVAGIDKNRVLIKIAATWEGIQAAQQLQAQGIACNLTLLFCPAQAAACAHAGVTLISPFVGRIFDWYTKSTGQTYTAQNDPGVLSVQRIYNYYKTHGISTEIMAASFRNTGQILALAGCDLLTISPELLAQLAASELPVEHAMPSESSGEDWSLMGSNQAAFRYALNEDVMASDKLAEGIRAFASDANKLDTLIATKIAALG